jgi:ABC-2 type transport system permease protein
VRAFLTNNVYNQVVSSETQSQVASGGSRDGNGAYVTTTGELSFKVGDRFTANASRTKTAVGFFRNESVSLGGGVDVYVGNTMNNYAVLNLTSLTSSDIPSSSKLLYTIAGYYTVPGEWSRTPGQNTYSWGTDTPRVEAVPSKVHISTFNWAGFYTLVRREVGRTKRVIGQAIITPLVTASLYIFVFGYVIGSKIDLIQGIKYISFVFPGVFAMNLVMAVFSATSFSIFFMKFQKTIEDMLTLPLSYVELVISLIFGGIVRALGISVALAVVAFLFGVNELAHPLVLLGYVLLASILFGLLGVVAGIWADNNFEKFGFITNFILTPLSFLGGAFYSVTMLPETWQFLVHFNPIFYVVDGIRYALTGYHEASLLLGVSILGGLSVITLGICVWIFTTGWKLRA